ncbi:MAG: hypothetical protein IPJ28_11720 [Betaproteobacteria bacterium]|nr:hypothetical protein [Betaproteobacteria bacterium]
MKDKSAAQPLAAPSAQNLWMGIAAVALAMMAWKATGQVGFLVMAAGVAALTPAWSFRTAGAGRASPKWARGLVGPGLFLVVAGAFQILAR